MSIKSIGNTLVTTPFENSTTTATQPPPLPSEIAFKVLALKCAFPFAGKNQGSGKLTSCCPACGAGRTMYTYPKSSRFKHCFACGFDRFEQRLLESIRADAKNGRHINLDLANRTIEYHRKVFARVSAKALAQPSVNGNS
jgi:hypothetical protein